MEYNIRPLQKFVAAKKYVTNIFSNLNNFIIDVEKFNDIANKYFNDPFFSHCILNDFSFNTDDSNYISTMVTGYV